MPFQVVQTTFINRREPVTLIDVVDNQFFICNTAFVPVTLTATVIGPPSGHTFEWELVTFNGNALIPNPDMPQGSIFPAGPAPTFDFNYVMEFGPPGFPGIFSTADMYWEFVIDRGTPEEQRGNTVVFFTPTAMLGTTSLLPPAKTVNPLVTVSGGNTINQDGRALLFANSDRRISNLTVTPANPLTPQCIGGHITDKFLTWTVGPDVSDDFIDLTVFENATGTFVPVATFTDPSVIYFTAVGSGNSYKLRVRMNDGVGKSQYITEREIGPIFIDTSGVPAAFSPFQTSLILNHDRGNVRVDNLNTFLITIKTQNLLADKDLHAPVSNRRPNNGSIRVDNFNTFLISLKVLSPLADKDLHAPVSNRRPNNGSIRVDNFNVIDLNGGAIGGG